MHPHIDLYAKKKFQLHLSLIHIFSLLQNYVSNKELEMFALIIHDMTSFCSSVYYVDATAVRKKEFDHFISVSYTHLDVYKRQERYGW